MLPVGIVEINTQIVVIRVVEPVPAILRGDEAEPDGAALLGDLGGRDLAKREGDGGDLCQHDGEAAIVFGAVEACAEVIGLAGAQLVNDAEVVVAAAVVVAGKLVPVGVIEIAEGVPVGGGSEDIPAILLGNEAEIGIAARLADLSRRGLAEGKSGSVNFRLFRDISGRPIVNNTKSVLIKTDEHIVKRRGFCGIIGIEADGDLIVERQVAVLAQSQSGERIRIH